MDKLVLDRLIELAEAPGKVAVADAIALRNQIFNMQREIDRLRAAVSVSTKAELPFSDLARAADAVIKARPGRARTNAISHLSSALLVANDHIDWIPF